MRLHKRPFAYRFLLATSAAILMACPASPPVEDAGQEPSPSAPVDSGAPSADPDAGQVDAGGPGLLDAGASDAGSIDVGQSDAGPTEPECESTGDCEGGETCVAQECRVVCAINESCPFEEPVCDLETNSCVEGCISDEHCATSEICENNVCREAECTIDSDCDGGFVCRERECQEVAPCSAGTTTCEGSEFSRCADDGLTQERTLCLETERCFEDEASQAFDGGCFVSSYAKMKPHVRGPGELVALEYPYVADVGSEVVISAGLSRPSSEEAEIAEYFWEFRGVGTGSTNGHGVGYIDSETVGESVVELGAVDTLGVESVVNDVIVITWRN